MWDMSLAPAESSYWTELEPWVRLTSSSRAELLNQARVLSEIHELKSSFTYQVIARWAYYSLSLAREMHP